MTVINFFPQSKLEDQNCLEGSCSEDVMGSEQSRHNSEFPFIQSFVDETVSKNKQKICQKKNLFHFAMPQKYLNSKYIKQTFFDSTKLKVV